MKKLIMMFGIMLSFGVITTSAQTTDFKVAGHLGVPVGDVAEGSDFVLAVDATYLFGVAGLIEAGPMAGYTRFFADATDASFLPIAASGRVDLPGFFAGLDLGYGIGLNDGIDGGFYYRPKIGFGFFGFNVIGSYQSISVNDGNFSAVTAGVEIGF